MSVVVKQGSNFSGHRRRDDSQGSKGGPEVNTSSAGKEYPSQFARPEPPKQNTTKRYLTYCIQAIKLIVALLVSLFILYVLIDNYNSRRGAEEVSIDDVNDASNESAPEDTSVKDAQDPIQPKPTRPDPEPKSKSARMFVLLLDVLFVFLFVAILSIYVYEEVVERLPV
ncbi:hypothetical protein QCA50_005994 [Cerrena zonata]|uniref:Uncharacterized protein n=1 Tax=Cerrena zonata TaxID=2478898 RepID=A0AAW0GEI8_9APHY